MTSKEFNWLRLHMTCGLGRAGLLRLMETFQTPEAILDAKPASWTERAGIRPSVAASLPKENDPELLRTIERMEKLDVAVISLWDNHYPPALRTIYDPPVLLYLLGQLPETDCFAIVGARKASEAGQRLTAQISSELAARNISIVSGLARGIDSAAHQGALEKGRTVAVLGCGIDRIYPPENTALFHRIARQGAILSEYSPGTPPLPGHFPGRNRIISGLSKGVLVVEAAAKSGSLLTAEFALDQGREVFAVPGPVHADGSKGVHRLLKDGAHLVTETRDILEVLWPQSRAPADAEQNQMAAGLSGKPLLVYEALGQEAQHIDQLARKCALTPMELSAILLHLEFAGGVKQLPGLRYVRK